MHDPPPITASTMTLRAMCVEDVLMCTPLCTLKTSSSTPQTSIHTHRIILIVCSIADHWMPSHRVQVWAGEREDGAGEQLRAGQLQQQRGARCGRQVPAGECCDDKNVCHHATSTTRHQPTHSTANTMCHGKTALPHCLSCLVAC